MPQTQPARDTRAILLARSAALSAHEPNFARFLHYAIEATGAEDLLGYSPESMEAFLRESYARLGQREPQPHAVYFSRPWGDAGPEIVEIFCRDMPFIVDSVLAAIRATGGTIRLVAHPTMPVDPESYRVLERPGGPGATLESMLHVHIDPLLDAAARGAMSAEIEAVLGEVARAVEGWKPMLARLQAAIAEFEAHPPPIPADLFGETLEFLRWLSRDNFTFLGMRDYRLTGSSGQAVELDPVEASGLGLLSDPGYRFLRAGPDFVESTPQHAAFMADPEPLIVTKANVRARVHRRAHMDYVGLKLFGPGGKTTGELRIIGLFTSASLAMRHAEVPLVRRKLAEVIDRSGLAPASHDGKALLNALESYPRDELFQISVDQLQEFSAVVAALPDRPRVRVLPRIGKFDNFVSILVYLPRERYDSEVRSRIGAHLAGRYEGRVSAFYPHFPEGELVRVHFIIGRNGGPTPRPGQEALEVEIDHLSRSFGELVAAAADDLVSVLPWRAAFGPGYQAGNSPERALGDIAVFDTLSEGAGVAVRLLEAPAGLMLRFYHQGPPIPLSDRVPLLEDFGFRVIDEQTHRIVPADGIERHLHEMILDAAGPIDLGQAGRRIEAAILAVWSGGAESDGFNALALKAGLAWPDITILRAMSRYLRQVGLGFSQSYVAAVLAQHRDVATALCAMFHALHDPAFSGNRDRAVQIARELVSRALDRIRSLDEDRIVRRLLNLVEASLRTNFYQREADGRTRPALAVKFDSARIEGLPEPKPHREIFVYSPRLEGLHLRFGPIARGGIRWSDRPEDFRTEVLGLVKAQQVKNAIIVPVGAKGAFVPKLLRAGADREAVQAEGTACYATFISSLLDVTDNLHGEVVVPPADMRRRDGDDPYLVVAADKGTARFSDLANSIAIERGFWLGDAFASGGSVGYDHKQMGITARGAWEAVKRHFREMDRDVQKGPFTAVGVGDMSGDVFGNGMLQSAMTKLVAAFDHRDIFIDPDPDPAASYAERKRLFALPRSSWQDYDAKQLSDGGGIYSRAEKTVPLSPQARTRLGLGPEALTPAEVIRAILCAEVDLLFFGGIGTYVRASSENDADAGDRANDAVRVTGARLRAKVIGEGANLAMTQLGRIEYALGGGRLNTDAIDNSAGVNSSDLEVNIKIALASVLRSGGLGEEERRAFLSSMTPEVAALCLRNNYLQTLALSLSESAAAVELPAHRMLIGAMEARGALDRSVEYLPDDATLDARAAAGRGLTRPELAVLLAYSKNEVTASLLQSAALEDLYLGRELFRYFPETLADAWPDAVSSHRLRREIIATVLANAMINRGGPTFVSELTQATSAEPGQAAAAYATARDVYGLTELHATVDALDGRVAGATQLSLYGEIRALLARETLWFLRNGVPGEGLSAVVDFYRARIEEVRLMLPGLLPPSLAASNARRAELFARGRTPADVAERIALLRPLSLSTDVVLIAARTGASIAEAASVFFQVLQVFDLGDLVETSESFLPADRFDRMALDRALANLTRGLRDLTADILATAGDGPDEKLAAWQAQRALVLGRTVGAIARLRDGPLTVSRVTVAAGLLSDLALPA